MATNNPSMTNDFSNSASRLADEGQAKAERLADAARDTVDRASAAARDTVDRLSDTASEFADQMGTQGDRVLAQARDYVAAHPISTLAAAAAAGYFIGRLMR